MNEDKRACLICGLVHYGCPFIDCFDDSEGTPDSLQDYYISKFGDD
jgi:hypothetical protein